MALTLSCNQIKKLLNQLWKNVDCNGNRKTVGFKNFSIFCVFMIFQKLLSVFPFPVLKDKLHVQNLSKCYRHKFLWSVYFSNIIFGVFFSIWPNCATAANLEGWLGGHRRLLHYYLNGLQPLCSPLRFSFGLFGPGKQKKS